MKEVGENFSTSGPENHGFSSLNSVSWNLNQEEIYKIILDRGEGKLSKDGAMVVETGVHTGRSAQDKFVVKEPQNEFGGIMQKRCLKIILILFMKI